MIQRIIEKTQQKQQFVNWFIISRSVDVCCFSFSLAVRMVASPDTLSQTCARQAADGCGNVGIYGCDFWSISLGYECGPCLEEEKHFQWDDIRESGLLNELILGVFLKDSHSDSKGKTCSSYFEQRGLSRTLILNLQWRVQTKPMLWFDSMFTLRYLRLTIESDVRPIREVWFRFLCFFTGGVPLLCVFHVFFAVSFCVRRFGHHQQSASRHAQDVLEIRFPLFGGLVSCKWTSRAGSQSTSHLQHLKAGHLELLQFPPLFC